MVLTRTEGTRRLPKAVERSDHWVGYFDGGSAKKKGTGGWLVFDEKGVLL